MTWTLLYPVQPIKKIFRSADAVKIDVQLSRVPDFVKGSAHTLDTGFTVSLNGDASTLFHLLLPFQADNVQHLGVGQDGEIDIGPGASGHPALFVVKSFGITEWDSGAIAEWKNGSDLIADAGATVDLNVAVKVAGVGHHTPGTTIPVTDAMSCSGAVTVAGVTTCNAGIQCNGSINITGSCLVTGTATIGVLNVVGAASCGAGLSVTGSITATVDVSCVNVIPSGTVVIHKATGTDGSVNVTVSSDIIEVPTLTVNRTWTLQAASVRRRVSIVRRADGGNKTLTIVDGPSSGGLGIINDAVGTAFWGSLQLYWDGSNWMVEGYSGSVTNT